MEIVGMIALVACGYVGSIYSWPWLRTKIGGVDAEITRLNARVNTLPRTR